MIQAINSISFNGIQNASRAKRTLTQQQKIDKNIKHIENLNKGTTYTTAAAAGLALLSPLNPLLLSIGLSTSLVAVFGNAISRTIIEKNLSKETQNNISTL